MPLCGRFSPVFAVSCPTGTFQFLKSCYLTDLETVDTSMYDSKNTSELPLKDVQNPFADVLEVSITLSRRSHECLQNASGSYPGVVVISSPPLEFFKYYQLFHNPGVFVFAKSWFEMSDSRYYCTIFLSLQKFWAENFAWTKNRRRVRKNKIHWDIEIFILKLC